MKLRVGILDAEAKQKHPSRPGVTIGQIAVAHEYGQPWRKPPTPRRSWLFDWFDENVDIIVKQLGADTHRVVMAGENEWLALSKRGSVYRQQIVDRIRYANPFKGNAAATIRSKGFDLPLIDSEEFIEAIRWEAVR
jgi:hypothetical protein